MENGDHQKLLDIEAWLEKVEKRVEEVRKDFPSPERCHAHASGLRRMRRAICEVRELVQKLELRIPAAEDWRRIQDSAIPPKEWSDMKKDVLDLRMNAVRVGVIVTLIVVISTWIASAVVVKSVDKAFAREAQKVEATR